MYFDLIFKILLAIFAAFGVLSLVKCLANLAKRDENVGIYVRIMTQKNADDAEMLLHEASRARFFGGCGKINVLISKNLEDISGIVEKLKNFEVDFYIV